MSPDSFLHNAHPAYFEAMYAQYLQQPEQLDSSWRHFFAGFSLAQSQNGAA
ncbi:MAG: hypothetical protein CVV27_02190, partial [Candidatus Melainabacteria bacterium HGW-Melainabacteria-1]